MSVTVRRVLTALVLAGFMITAGCATRELILESKNAVVPDDIDISGYWELLGDDDARRRPTGDSRPILETRTTTRGRTERARRGSSVHVFLEYGQSLKVSQTEWSLFISYDRAIVEEYTFGENRTISIGPIEARRVSGWEGDAFVVETLDASGVTLYESWRLESADSLQRDIRIVDDEREIFALQQSFARK